MQAITKVFSDIVKPYIDSENQTLTNNDTAMLNVLGAKNLLLNRATTQTMSGITFTINSDGSVRATGTATAPVGLTIGSVSVKSGNSYILTGCPSGGGSGTYSLSIQGVGQDLGDGLEYTPLSDSTINFNVNIFKVNEAVDLLFKPMIRPASVADDTYVPYAMTNRELTERIYTGRIEKTGQSLNSGWMDKTCAFDKTLPSIPKVINITPTNEWATFPYYIKSKTTTGFVLSIYAESAASGVLISFDYLAVL